MRVKEETVAFTSAEWGPATIAAQDLDLVSEFTGTPACECLERVSSYRLAEMASAWRRADPRTPEQIRSFYEQTDLYLWELLGWNGSAAYEPYLRRLDRLAELWPPASNPCALDYGSGVGTAALRLAELGYRVTIADVPCRILEFARKRLERRELPFDLLEIVDDPPALVGQTWNVLTCFDVLEHVPDPAAVARSLVRALFPGGGAAVVASFGGTDQHPHHLAGGIERFGGHRWHLYLQGLGMQHVGDCLYRRHRGLDAFLRQLRYRMWRITGIHVERPGR